MIERAGAVWTYSEDLVEGCALGWGAGKGPDGGGDRGGMSRECWPQRWPEDQIAEEGRRHGGGGVAGATATVDETVRSLTSASQSAIQNVKVEPGCFPIGIFEITGFCTCFRGNCRFSGEALLGLCVYHMDNRCSFTFLVRGVFPGETRSVGSPFVSMPW